MVTDQPIRSVLEKPENSGRLAKWAIELGEHNITYVPRKAIKAQVLADFIVEVPKQTVTEVNTAATEPSNPKPGSFLPMELQVLKGQGPGLF